MPNNDNPIQAVAFDLDGLMFNTEDLWEIVSDQLLARRGKRPSKEFSRQVTGRPAKVALPMLIEWFQLNDTTDQIQSEINDLFDEMLDDHLAPMPGLIELLRAVHNAGIPRAITTSSGRRFVDRLLQIYKIEFEFSFFLTAEKVENGKPHPEIYESAARRFGVHPATMMVLEDSEIGCQAATAAGAFAVAVPTHKSAEHDFPNVKFVAESLEDQRIFQALGLV